ncbi:MAG TPA: transglycosylase domain-containing protein [Bacteroidales bacterium]|nr:transglycosylase domain-containing protein [Bacteroidales bacterium]
MGRFRKLGKFLLILSITGFVAIIVFVLSVGLGAFGHLQSREELTNYKNAQASVVLSGSGELIGKFFSENRTNVSFYELPPHLVNALIATEDIRFYKHKGYDVKSFFRVIVKTILLNNRRAGGGSTITQQLAKNMYGRANYGSLTILVNKVKEIILARRIEKSFSKQEILLLYLNTVSFGENVYGIEAAARRFFNKEVKDLNIEEGAVLIGILKANNLYNPRLYPVNAKNRRNVVLGQMKKYNFLEPAAADSLMNLPLVHNYLNYEAGGPADYFLYQVKQEAASILGDIGNSTGHLWNIEEDGLVITTTLDLQLQNYANEAFKEHLVVMQARLNKQYESRSGRRAAEIVANRELKRLNMDGRAEEISLLDYSDSTEIKPVTVRDSMIMAVKILHAGLLAINPVTGAVKAWVGGIDFKTHPYDQVLARRQLASTFKPVLYAEAFEEGMRPCDYLENDSITDSGIDGWTPSNFDNTYGGKYSLAGALVHSMNVPTYNLFLNVDFDRLDSLWQKMGFSYTINNYPSLPMGIAEANIREVAIAYSAFANGGYKITHHCIESIMTQSGELIWQNKYEKPEEKILSDYTVSVMRAILRKAVTSGTGVAMAGTYGVTLPFAGKTGTSTDYADAWFSAFNPSLVIVSRVGASSPAIHFNSGSYGSGSALALPLVARTLKKVQDNKKLSAELISPFPGLPEELASELDCPDYKEITFIENVLDFFRSNRKTFDREVTKPEQKLKEPGDKSNEPGEKESFFRRIFQKRPKK